MLESTRGDRLPELKTVISLKGSAGRCIRTYHEFRQAGDAISDAELQSIMRFQSADQVCNLQFTSGTTGTPKAAMLTHS